MIATFLNKELKLFFERKELELLTLKTIKRKSLNY